MRFLRWAPTAQSAVSAFVNVNVIPMFLDRVLPSQTVIIRDGRISAIGPAESIVVPPGAKRIDGTNKFLIPGLADMHVHIFGPSEMLLYLANGVTTVRNMDGRPEHLLWREKITQARMLGPTIYTTGPIIHTADTFEESEKLVEAQFRARYDAIKVYDEILPGGYRGITWTARRLGIPVVGHINAALGLEGVLEAGQSSIEHAEEYATVVFKNDFDTPDAAITKAAADTRAALTWFTPTLVVFGNVVQQLEDLPGLLSKAEFRYLPPWAQKEWAPPNNYYLERFGKGKAPEFQRMWRFHKRIVSEMHREGVPVLLGTDSMVTGTIPGFSVPEELRNLVEVGLTPFEALQTATRNAAIFLDAADQFGTVAVGSRADLLLLNANPLTEVGNVTDKSGVMIRGVWLPQAEIEKMLSGLPEAYARENDFVSSNLKSHPRLVGQYLRDNDPFYELTDEVLLDFIDKEDVVSLIKLYSQLQRIDRGSFLIEEEAIDDLGERLLDIKNFTAAIQVFKFNTHSHPASAAAYDSLAEANAMAGNRAEAIRCYKKAIELDSKSNRAREQLARLESDTTRSVSTGPCEGEAKSMPGLGDTG